MARTSQVKASPKRKRTRVKKAASRSSAAPLSRQEALGGVKRDQLGHLLIEQQLYERGFHGTIATDAATLDAYSTDESIFAIRPQIVIQPKTVRDVEVAVSVVREASEKFEAVSLTPRAAGTGLSGGSLTDSVVLDVNAHLTYVSEPNQSRGTCTITCQPGAMWRDVEKALSAVGHYLPPYPASRDICTVGGAVANNAAGPDSLRYGHVADWIESLDVTFSDGNTYTVRPLSYSEYKKLAKESHEYARIAREVFALIEQHYRAIKRAEPHTKKNSAGYALWDVLDVSPREFSRGIGTFDLTRLIAGSQGTLGIITKIVFRTAPVNKHTSLIAVPVFDLKAAGSVVKEALVHDPINVEVFDDLSFDLALKNPQFFRSRLTGAAYYKTLFAMYVAYHVRYKQKSPPFTLLITLDHTNLSDTQVKDVVAALKRHAAGARLVVNPYEAEMFWQVRRASYTLSKMQDPNKRPAAFLEDMVVPPKHLAPFFTNIKRLLKKYNVTAAVHGHGGNGHFHFYPLLDFTRKSTPALIVKMAEEFFDVAMKYDGNLCGEHNDGIIRTPHLSKMFSKQILTLFADVEHCFDPNDIFNPGKKVNPRFDIKENIRTTN